MRQYQDIESIIKAHGGFISKGELTSVQYHRLLSELGNGSIVRVRKGVYALQDALLNTMYDMGKIVPECSAPFLPGRILILPHRYRKKSVLRYVVEDESFFLTIRLSSYIIKVKIN